MVLQCPKTNPGTHDTYCSKTTLGNSWNGRHNDSSFVTHWLPTCGIGPIQWHKHIWTEIHVTVYATNITNPKREANRRTLPSRKTATYIAMSNWKSNITPFFFDGPSPSPINGHTLFKSSHVECRMTNLTSMEHFDKPISIFKPALHKNFTNSTAKLDAGCPANQESNENTM